MTQVETKPSYPFNKIAVAIAFSPRLEAILAESKRLQEKFKAQMIFIHVGEKNLQQEQYLKHLLHRFGLEKQENSLLWEDGDPVEIILEKSKELDIDLIVAGAMEKENLLKYFIGSIARKLCRRAKCSVLMLREPSLQPKPIMKIVVEGSDHPKSVQTVETAIYIAKQVGSSHVNIVQESDISKMALIRSTENLTDTESDKRREKLFKEENERLAETLKCNDCGSLKVNVERIDGKPGYVISTFAREQKADLLILNSPDTKLNFLDRVFPHDIEYALANLPCDLMIVHSKTEE
jgi:nucleotide-binding universal stress UspA family protein